jgi:site-specific recombinase XerD
MFSRMKLLERLDVVARRRGMADATIEAYSLWVKQFLAFSARRHGAWKPPGELFTEDVEAFFNDLVVERRLAASTQNQALNALVFLYKQVLDDIPTDHLGKFALLRSRRRPGCPWCCRSMRCGG